jgi:cytochrome c peroxidase
MLLRVVACAFFVLSVGLLGCQPAPDVPLSDAGSPPPADHAHDHDHPHGDHDHPHAADAPKSAMDQPAAEAVKPDEPAAAASADKGSQKAEELPTEIVLGEDAALYQGISGEGALTLEQVKAWLARPDVHNELTVKLPLGLSQGEGQIAGLDENPLTRAKVELGRQLYFDPRLSSDASISCASCHHPETGYTAATQFGVGVGGQEGNRNSPVSYNRILSTLQFWDGRAFSLEDQAKGPIANPIEMSNTHDVAVTTIDENPVYKAQFDAIFGENSCDIDNVARAIAAFERTIVTGASAYDYYAALKPFTDQFGEEDLEELKEDAPEIYEQYLAAKKAAEEHPMSESARRGAELFFDKKSGCTQCHVGANFTDEKYHNIGVGMDVESPDLGRYEVTGEEQDKGAFKTPTVRNVEFTAPYMHDGSQQTLEEVVEWYVKGGHPNEWLSEKIVKLDLTEQDKKDLVAFMKALSGPFPKVETARLPEGEPILP